MSGRGAAVLLTVATSAGLTWADPAPAVPQPDVRLDVLLVRLRPQAWDALKGALGRSVLPATIQGDPKGAVAGVLRKEQEEGITRIIEKLEKRKLARVQARPRLVTKGGRPASFLDGGEAAVPVPAGRGSVGVQFEEFGTRLNFLPVVMADGRIRLEVEPEVSDLKDTGFAIAGATVPGRVTRRLNAVAEMGEGQMFVVGGLGGKDRVTEMECVPALRELPYVRHLFGWEVTREEEYDLLLLVVPHVVKPAGAAPR